MLFNKPDNLRLLSCSLNGFKDACLVKGGMKTYMAKRIGGRTLVTVDGHPLDARFNVWVHSFDGFDWGHCGAGSMQLGLALLADHLNDERQAAKMCHAFVAAIIARLSQTEWCLTSQQIHEAIESLQISSAR